MCSILKVCYMLEGCFKDCSKMALYITVANFDTYFLSCTLIWSRMLRYTIYRKIQFLKFYRNLAVEKIYLECY